MKNIILTSLIIVFTGVTGFGQQSKTARVNGSSSQSGTANASSNGGSVSLTDGTVLQGELQKTLDVKNARPGDQVLLKTTRDIKQNGRTVVSKGSTLVGHVTDVAQRSKQNNQSRLGILFDRVQGKGVDMPINASIVSITQAAGSANVADLGDFDMMGSSSTSGGVSRSGGSSGGGLLGSGGGLLGGAGNTVGGLGNTVGGVAGGVTYTAGGVVNTARGTVGGVTNGVGNTAGGVTRSINGISIINSGSTNASAGNGSILASSDRNIRIEKGSMIGLSVNSSSSASASRGH